MTEKLVAIAGSPVSTAGIITYWTLIGALNYETLSDAWATAGLDEDELIGRTSDEAALRLAVKDQQRTHRLARQVVGGWAIVDEQLHGQELSYSTVLRVAVDTGGLRFSSGDADTDAGTLVGDITQSYGALRANAPAGAVGSWLSAQVRRLHGVALRPSGGVYFIPNPGVEEWRQIVDAVRLSSEHGVYEIPAMQSDEAIAAILSAVQAEASAELAALAEDMEDETLGKRALETREARCQAAVGKLLVYREFLGDQLFSVIAKVEELQAQFTAKAKAKGDEHTLASLRADDGGKAMAALHEQAVASLPARPAPLTTFIMTSNARVYIDVNAYDVGELKLASGTMSDQCDGCGRDIIESGRIIKAIGDVHHVRCTSCDASFMIVTHLEEV